MSESDFSYTDYNDINAWALLHPKNRAVSHIEEVELVRGVMPLLR